MSDETREEIEFEPYATELYLDAMDFAADKPVDWGITYMQAGPDAFFYMFARRHIDFGVRSGKTTAAVQFAGRSAEFGVVTYSVDLAARLRERHSINALGKSEYVKDNPHWGFTIFDDVLSPTEYPRESGPSLKTMLLANKPHRFICLGV